MEMREWVERLMGLGPEWRIERVDEDSERQEARVALARRAGSPLRCPECGRTCLGYDVPRVECPEHGVGDDAGAVGGGAVEVHGGVRVAGARGERAGGVAAAERGRDVVKRGHRYVTVVSDSETKDVLYVAPGRSREARERRPAAVESVSMDMWRPYVAATEAWVAGARSKTAFDRFHVAKPLGDAVDKVRRAERKELKARGNAVLAGTRYQWLRGADKKTHAEKLAFAELRKSVERTSQAWALKEAASKLWRYRSRCGRTRRGCAGCNGRRPPGSGRSRRRRRWSGRTCGASSTPSCLMPPTARPRASTAVSKRSRPGAVASATRTASPRPALTRRAPCHLRSVPVPCPSHHIRQRAPDAYRE